MGGAISENLVRAGFDVIGFDIDASRLARLAEVGGRAGVSAANVARDAEIVLVSLPSASAFEAVVLAEDGLGGAARDGLVVVEMSTLPIALKERGRDALQRRAVCLLDCPVSGTGDQAIHGDVVVLASGDRSAVARCEPIFEGFARSHHYLGEFGAGSKMKFVANLLVAIHNIAAAEALSLAEAAGLELKQTLEVIADGAGSSRMFEVRGPKMVARSYESGVRTTVFQKDLAAISDFATAAGAPVPLLALCSQFYVAAAAAGYGDEDTASVYEILKQMRTDERQ
jgi:3-hydroxyisobutyrate dehydrogenase-like beta-hydroxyacid dehydrogenase